MARYKRQRETATRLIKKYGEQVTWNVSRETPSNDQPWLGGTVETIAKRPYVVFVTSSSQVKQLFQMMTGTDVPTGQNLGYMGPTDFEPTTLDTVVRSDGRTYRIKSIDPLKPNEEATILYTMEFME